MINKIIALLYRRVFLILASLLIIAGATIVVITVVPTHAASAACPAQIQENSTNTAAVKELHKQLYDHYQSGTLKNNNPYHFAATSGGAFGGGFGPNTKLAVIDYQHQHGLGVDGIVGPQTWGSLLGVTCGGSSSSSGGGNSSSGGSGITFTNLDAKPGNGVCVSTSLGRGSSGSSVSTLQWALDQVGVQPQLSQDGQFGAKTEAAVVAYQKAKSISSDGNVGPQTWGKLGYSWQSNCGGSNGSGGSGGSGGACPTGQIGVYSAGQFHCEPSNGSSTGGSGNNISMAAYNACVAGAGGETSESQSVAVDNLCLGGPSSEAFNDCIKGGGSASVCIVYSVKSVKYN